MYIEKLNFSIKKKNKKYLSQNNFKISISYLKIIAYMYLLTIQGSVHRIVNVEKKTSSPKSLRFAFKSLKNCQIIIVYPVVS